MSQTPFALEREELKSVVLTGPEMNLLFRQQRTRSGGFQNLMLSLQELTDRETGRITIPQRLRERVRRYAYNYGQGGWENRLVEIFSRTLGKGL